MLFRKTIIFTILLIGVVYCQSWKIYTVDNSIIKFDNLSTVQNDTLFGIEYGDVNEVPVKNILRVSYRKTSSVRRGMMGGCIGLPLGILITASIVLQMSILTSNQIVPTSFDDVHLLQHDSCI